MDCVIENNFEVTQRYHSGFQDIRPPFLMIYESFPIFIIVTESKPIQQKVIA